MTALRKPITKGQVMPLTVSDEMIDAGMVPFNAPEKYRDARRYIEGIYLAMEAARIPSLLQRAEEAEREVKLLRAEINNCVRNKGGCQRVGP
jgi:hypothetical protein